MRYGTRSQQKPAAQPEQPSTSRALMGVSGHWVGSSVEWTVSSSQAPEQSLTPAEIKALETKHGSRNINTGRIAEVKRLMGMGKTQAQIIQKLRGRRGFGERQIKKDMSALSKVKK